VITYLDGSQDFARVSVKAYANANKNPLAHMHAVKMDLDTASTASDKNPNFLANEDLKPHLRTSDCSQVSDGASAMVVVSEEGLRRLGKSPRDAIEGAPTRAKTQHKLVFTPRLCLQCSPCRWLPTISTSIGTTTSSKRPTPLPSERSSPRVHVGQRDSDVIELPY
jgi:hypothetical protein